MKEIEEIVEILDCNPHDRELNKKIINEITNTLDYLYIFEDFNDLINIMTVEEIIESVPSADINIHHDYLCCCGHERKLISFNESDFIERELPYIVYELGYTIENVIQQYLEENDMSQNQLLKKLKLNYTVEDD